MSWTVMVIISSLLSAGFLSVLFPLIETLFATEVSLQIPVFSVTLNFLVPEAPMPTSPRVHVIVYSFVSRVPPS